MAELNPSTTKTKRNIFYTVLIFLAFISIPINTNASTLSERLIFYGLEEKVKESDVLNIKDFNAKGNGTSNDTVSVQNALDKASRTKQILYFPKGVYRVTTNDNEVTEANAIRMVNTDVGLKVGPNTHIIFDEEAVIEGIENAFHCYTVFNVKNAKNVTFQGGTIKGDRDKHLLTYKKDRKYFENYYGETGWGILVTGSSNVLIDDMVIKDMWGDAIDLFATNPTGTTNTNITIQNSVLSNNRRQGISVENVNGLTVKNNIIQSTKGTDPSAGIDIESADFKEHHLRESRNIVLSNNQFLNNNDSGILLYGLGTKIFSDKDKDGKMQKAMVDNVQIKNNLLKGNNTNHQNTQEGNWKGAFNGQLMTVGASNVTIDDNVFLDPKPLGSLDNNNTMARFKPNSNPTAGIYLGYSENINVSNNFMPEQDISVINQWSPIGTFAYPNAVKINLTKNSLNKVVSHKDINTQPDITSSGNIENVKKGTTKKSGTINIIVKDESGKTVKETVKPSREIGSILELKPLEEIPTGYKLIGARTLSPYVFSNGNQEITLTARKIKDDTEESSSSTSESSSTTTEESTSSTSESSSTTTEESTSSTSESSSTTTEESTSSTSESSSTTTEESKAKTGIPTNSTSSSNKTNGNSEDSVKKNYKILPQTGTDDSQTVVLALVAFGLLIGSVVLIKFQ